MLEILKDVQINIEYGRKNTPPRRILPDASIFINGLAESQTNLNDEKYQFFTNGRASINKIIQG